MKKISILLLLFFTGCAVVPKHYYGTENIPANELTSVTYAENELLIVSIDGQHYLGKDWEYVYLKPGVHEFIVRLNWDNMINIDSTSIITTETSPYLKKGCINMKAGKEYFLYARDPGVDWRFVVWETSKSIYDSTIDVPKCE